jgi:hypothetical protein
MILNDLSDRVIAGKHITRYSPVEWNWHGIFIFSDNSVRARISRVADHDEEIAFAQTECGLKGWAESGSADLK